ncbi:MAG: hypothetical protein ACPLRO_09705 [Candidatus Kapaibacteriota bacterium]
MPEEIANVLDSQKERLIEAQKIFGDYIPPDNSEVVMDLKMT